MPSIQRLNPLDFFTAEQWHRLTKRSGWRGLWLVAHAWGVIGLCMVVGAVWPWMIIVLIPVVAGRQLGLLILMHDGAHGLLHPNRKLNDAVSYWLCSSALHEYRPYHLQHHRYAMQSEDPDLGLAKPFPITQASLVRKFLRDLSGLSFLKLRFGVTVGGPHKPATPQLLGSGSKSKPVSGNRWGRAVRFMSTHRRFFLFSLGFFTAFALAGYAWLWLALWLVPMVCIFPILYRLRNMAEHAMLQLDEPSPLKQARTTRANWLERVVLAPYWVNYHCEHHMFTQLPCWQLPRAHRWLEQQGTTNEMAVVNGYRAVLKLATSAG
jgi:fatty acid desaturase